MAPQDPDQRPRDIGEPGENFPGENLADDEEDIDDASDDDSSSDGDGGSDGDSENEPNNDDRQARLERIARLRRRNQALQRQCEVEERLLEREVTLRDQVFRAVEIMEARVQELRAQRDQDLVEL